MGRDDFDLVVSDIVMAGDMDGIGLAREIRRTRPELPVILVTGYRSDAVFADAEFTVLRKPYKLAELGHAAAAAIAGARRSHAPPANLVQLHDVRRGTHRPKAP
jgi:DNA-binding NtrC family response regulator